MTLPIARWRAWTLLVAALVLLPPSILKSPFGQPSSRESALASNLCTLREAIERYRNAHGGSLPGQAGWSQFVEQVASVGEPLRPGVFVNPVTGRADGRVVATLPATATARPRWHWSESDDSWLDPIVNGLAEPDLEPSWVYCSATGELRANVAGAGPAAIPYFDL